MSLFTMQIDERTYKLLRKLARRQQRSMASTVRWLICDKVEELPLVNRRVVTPEGRRPDIPQETAPKTDIPTENERISMPA